MRRESAPNLESNYFLLIGPREFSSFRMATQAADKIASKWRDCLVSVFRMGYPMRAYEVLHPEADEPICHEDEFVLHQIAGNKAHVLLVDKPALARLIEMEQARLKDAKARDENS